MDFPRDIIRSNETSGDCGLGDRWINTDRGVEAGKRARDVDEGHIVEGGCSVEGEGKRRSKRGLVAMELVRHTMAPDIPQGGVSRQEQDMSTFPWNRCRLEIHARVRVPSSLCVLRKGVAIGTSLCPDFMIGSPTSRIEQEGEAGRTL
jgi:hypothetical protein